MEINFPSTLQTRLEQLARDTGRSSSELVQEATSSFLDEMQQTREMLDGRYDDLKSGRVKPIPGEEAFARLEELAQERLKRRA